MRRLTSARVSKSDDEIVRAAWNALPAAERAVLETIGASQWDVVDQPLGEAADAYLRSGGFRGITPAERLRLYGAVGVWLPPLKLMLINSAHSSLDGLDARSRERYLSHIAWHEWAHGLSMVRCTAEDIRAGETLLALAPPGIKENIRLASYPRKELTFEVIAELFALLMSRRLTGQEGRPSWLDPKTYVTMKRLTGWRS
jgi:hypothetical protein